MLVDSISKSDSHEEEKSINFSKRLILQKAKLDTQLSSKLNIKSNIQSMKNEFYIVIFIIDLFSETSKSQ